MTLEEYERPPTRTLSKAQERRLASKYLTGDFGAGKWETIASLLALGMVEEYGKSLRLTESGKHYCFHHAAAMSIG